MTTLRSVLIAQSPFVATNELAELCIVKEEHEDRCEEVWEDFPHLVFRLVVWEDRDNVRFIREVSEQSIAMPTSLPPELANHGGRTENFVTALKRVLSDVLCSRDICGRLPQDLLKFDPLGKKTFGTVQEFEQSLRRKGNLGKYL